jgi:predicted NAD-dependent protein-ADP-ribosyltransferase YbiA (DUF1768 family)
MRATAAMTPTPVVVVDMSQRVKEARHRQSEDMRLANEQRTKEYLATVDTPQDMLKHKSPMKNPKTHSPVGSPLSMVVIEKGRKSSRKVVDSAHEFIKHGFAKPDSLFFKSNRAADKSSWLSNFWPYCTQAAQLTATSHLSFCVIPMFDMKFDVDSPEIQGKFVVGTDPTVWLSVEHYYQAQRLTDPGLRHQISECKNAPAAKAMGTRFRNTYPKYTHAQSKNLNWKRETMNTAVMAKFLCNPVLALALIGTGNRDLHEMRGRQWSMWCLERTDSADCDELGRILMRVRTVLSEKLNDFKFLAGALCEQRMSLLLPITVATPEPPQPLQVSPVSTESDATPIVEDDTQTVVLINNPPSSSASSSSVYQEVSTPPPPPHPLSELKPAMDEYSVIEDTKRMIPIGCDIDMVCQEELEEFFFVEDHKRSLIWTTPLDVELTARALSFQQIIDLPLPYNTREVNNEDSIFFFGGQQLVS